MNRLLASTIETIELEQNKFNKSFDAVSNLIKEYGERDIASRLYSDIDSSISEHIISDLFGIIIWTANDNGSELMHTMEDWLIKAQSERQIKIALGLDVFPFKDTRIQVISA